MHTLLAASGDSHHSSAARILFIVIGALIVLFALAQVVNPRLGWQLNRWQFKNPQAMEPSAAGLTARRVSAGIVAVVGIVILVVGLSRS